MCLGKYIMRYVLKNVNDWFVIELVYFDYNKNHYNLLVR